MFRRRNRTVAFGAAKLNSVMPGAGGNSCLERYEYAKHGVCFGFDPDAYFGTMVRMNQEVKSSPLGQFPDNYGKPSTVATLMMPLPKAGAKRTSKPSS
jgi:ribonuclease I